jgi:hypothetical protein
MPGEVDSILTAERAITDTYEFGAYTVRLYEAPPRGQPARFGQEFAMLYRPLAQTAYQPGDTVRHALWWRALEAVPRDYSYGLYLRRAGESEIVAQVDAGLTADDKPTSQWQPSEDYTFG